MADNRLLAFFQQLLTSSSVEEPLLADEGMRRVIAAGITIDVNGQITLTQALIFPGTGLIGLPTHATTHKSGGGDAIKLDELAAPTDITTLNVSTSAHGLTPKLSNDATTFLNGVGTYTAPTRTEQTSTATGTQNDLSLSARHTLLRCNNASALIVTGFSIGGNAPTAGDSVVIVNVGSSTVRVAHQDAGSTTANRAVFPSARGQIIGSTGIIVLVYDGTTTRWRVQAVEPGVPIAIAYSAGDFTATGSMTWTVDSGDVTTARYLQHGSHVTLWMVLATTTTGGTTSNGLLFTLPNGFTAANQSTQLGAYGTVADSTPYSGISIWAIVIATSTTKIGFYKPDFANIALGTNNVTSSGTATFVVD
jgi:hypothetical protein